MVSEWFALFGGCLMLTVGMVNLARGPADSRPGARLNAAGLAVAGAGSALGVLPAVAGWTGVLRTAAGGTGCALSAIGAVLLVRWLWGEHVGRPARGGR